MRRFKSPAVVLLALGLPLVAAAETAIAVRSPDGRNEIRLHRSADALAYEVLRDNAVAVARTEVALKVEGRVLRPGTSCSVRRQTRGGSVPTPVYKKAKIDLAGNEAFVGFGDWGVRLAARNDGVAYRFETSREGRIRVDGERADLTLPDGAVRCWVNRTGAFGREASRPIARAPKDLKTVAGGSREFDGTALISLPLVYSTGRTFVAVTESDVRDYPVWYLTRTNASERTVRCRSVFAGWPAKTAREGGRWIRVKEHADWLCETEGTRTFPWRTFILADEPSRFCEADLVFALAASADAGADFSWVRPGKVAWDWWNCFDNQGDAGCNTRTYERFIDFAATNGIPYVILDEGWSRKLDIWTFNPAVDVPHLIAYAEQKGVGLVLWMAWAQVFGQEERVARHFAKLGAKGFKVDFIDRGDAEATGFVERFAAACAKERLLVNYHGVFRPTGLPRRYPNIVNYEAIHGLEHMKWFDGKGEDMMANDVRAAFLRMTAGAMDYTPGAMLNYPLGGYVKDPVRPGSVGTRCHQLAMLVAYEAPMQMLADSPGNYARNPAHLAFMAHVPDTWADTVALGGDPDSYFAVARRAKDGAWYAAAINSAEAREIELDLGFLGKGKWAGLALIDADDADVHPTAWNARDLKVDARDSAAAKYRVRLARGGGCVLRFRKKDIGL